MDGRHSTQENTVLVLFGDQLQPVIYVCVHFMSGSVREMAQSVTREPVSQYLTRVAVASSAEVWK